MKALLIFLLLIISVSSFSQNILGDWYGNLSISGIHLRIVLHISDSNSIYSSTMDSPDQGAYGIAMDSTTFNGVEIFIQSKQIGATYTGVLNDSNLTGTFVQNGNSLPLVLSRKEVPHEEVLRPQEPKSKFNYITKDVAFKNTQDSIILAGTLTIPEGKGPFMVAIMITGSGPQDRNEEILGHKPFLVIADHLAKENIAVLRFDDRGVGKSTGQFKGATSLDFVKDVEAAIAFLKTEKKIDSLKIGLIGHSEGGLIAPMVAAKPENNVAFSILLAGPGIRGKEIILMQQELISRVNGISEKEIVSDKQWTERLVEYIEINSSSPYFENDLKVFIDSLNTANNVPIPEGMTKEEIVEIQFNAFNDPWMKYFLFLDPTIALKQVKCPVLALNGSLDLQVPPKENLTAIKKAIESNGNKNVTIVELKELNHLFQTAKTGSPNEYAEISETFSPEALKIISDWLLELNHDHKKNLK